MSDIPQFVVPKNITVGKALQKVGQATVSALVKITGKDIKSVRTALKILYTTNKVHIGSYELTKRGKLSRVWHWGDGDDAKEPVIDKNEFIPHADIAAAWLRNPT
jgi:predicted short-subunit dehydrogenase-like oxidoreductase (DUF2520 family)